MCARTCVCVCVTEREAESVWLPVVYASYFLSDDNTSAAFGNRPLYAITFVDLLADCF